MTKFALHTAEVAVGDDQTKAEATYEGYARVEPKENGRLYFPAAEANAGEVISHYSAADENGKIIAVGVLTPQILIQLTAEPSFINEAV